MNVLTETSLASPIKRGGVASGYDKKASAPTAVHTGALKASKIGIERKD
jgi:hypothetical protein